MIGFLKKFFDYNAKEVDRLKKKATDINVLEDQARALKDEDFIRESKKLRERIQSGEKTVEDALPWAYALVREASKRVLGERHFDVQLVAGISLYEGKIAEQKTGEGKTLSATTALYLNGLTGKGAHLVTVNDYLARRDCGWMGVVFHFLGLTTSAIISDKSYIYDHEYVDKNAQDWRLIHLRQISRKEAYLADITYGINSEFGFDYLRDNMASDTLGLVQRGFNFAIIDEADSVLIDEARTPHIISAPYDEDTSKYYRYAQIVKQLKDKTDYVIDEKARTANLTEQGVLKIESILHVTNVYEKDFDTLFHIEASLKAETLFKNNKDYIVKDGEVIIVDEFTGRLLYGRRFSEGIHQAIEAKENVSIQKESKTLATVSLQNYFRMYKKLAGMTGTASTEAEEFNKIYKTDVLTIPTHMPMVRKDHPDMIYKTEKGKFDAVVEEVAQSYAKGRPVLVGTTSIEKNEYLSSLLRKRGVPHELLNAKNHLQEAQIISRAGEKGAVTVATNMAGRGVDIILGGQSPNKYESNVKTQNLKVKMESIYEEEVRKWRKKHDEVVSLGGLYVIGTERHESRRIDNQLRGRAGRQGDPGETRFFVSLSDDLMRIFGGDQISKLMTFFNFPEDQPLTHSMVSKAIESAQVKVEGYNFDIRKHLVDYDDVLNKQREIIYTLRKKMLLLPETDEVEFKKTVLEIFNEEAQELITQHFYEEGPVNEELRETFVKEVGFIVPFEAKSAEKYFDNKNIQGLTKLLIQSIESEFNKREKKFSKKMWYEITRIVFLSTIDKYWTDHLTSIEDLREGINLRGYAQLDPLVEYKNEAFSMFERLVGEINFEVTRRLFKIEVGKIQEEPREEKPMVFKSASAVDPFSQKQQTAQPQQIQTLPKQQETGSQEQTGFKVIPPGTKQRKIGRNDPCWCGSGKKYKRCHYPN